MHDYCMRKLRYFKGERYTEWANRSRKVSEQRKLLLYCIG